MFGKRILVAAIAATTALTAATACSRYNNEEAGVLAPANSIGIEVHNQNFLAMDVYSVTQGVAERLGTVSGNSTGMFMLPPTMAAQDFRIIGAPIGGNGQASSGRLNAAAGQTVVFTIGTDLRNSSAYLR